MNQEEQFGYVYILKNEKMPGLIKIGMTRRDDYKKRISELNRATGVPVPFEEVRVSKVSLKDCAKIESVLHTAFDTDRVNPKREFFQMEAWRAIAVLSLVEIEDVTEKMRRETTESLAPQEIEAREKAEKMNEESERMHRTRRPILNFFDLGISAEEHLYWKDNNTRFVTVADERKVVFDGEVCSLTAATSKILGRAYNIQPTPYWTYKGRILMDIYNEKFPPIDE